MSVNELVYSTNSMISDIKDALDILDDHWPSSDDDDLNQAYKMVEWDLRKKLKILEEP